MAGLDLLKHMKGLSDEEVCTAWLENSYLQLFCGEEHFQHRLPFDLSSTTRWRQRMGADALEALLAETLAVAEKTEVVSHRQLERITVDTTIQTEAITHPTDSHLMLRAIEWLNRMGRRQGIKRRQSFLRLAGHARHEGPVVCSTPPGTGRVFADCAPGSVGCIATSVARSPASSRR